MANHDSGPMKFIPALCLSLVVSSSSLFADGAAANDKAAPATYFAAAKVMTLQGTLEAADRFGQADFNSFNAGDGFVMTQEDNNFTQGANVTLKGIAAFDLNADGMRAALTNPGEQHLILSFALMQIEGKPRPLRVEYVGTFDDVAQTSAFSSVFQAAQIIQRNNVLRRGDSNGLKLVDLTPLTQQSLPKRWLVIRFEQEGLRIENSGQDDLYQLNPSADTVRLTLSDKDAHGKTVAQHYQSSGYYNLTKDMSSNLLGDMQSNLEPDESTNLTPDMSSDLTPDMSSNLTPDLPNNLIQDGNN